MTTLEEVSKGLQDCRITCDMRAYGKEFGLRELTLYTEPEIVISLSSDVVTAIKCGSAVVFGIDLKFSKLEAGVIIYVYDDYGNKVGQVMGDRV